MLDIRCLAEPNGVRYLVVDAGIEGHAADEEDAHYKTLVFIRMIYAGAIPMTA